LIRTFKIWCVWLTWNVGCCWITKVYPKVSGLSR